MYGWVGESHGENKLAHTTHSQSLTVHSCVVAHRSFVRSSSSLSLSLSLSVIVSLCRCVVASLLCKVIKASIVVLRRRVVVLLLNWLLLVVALNRVSSRPSRHTNGVEVTF